MAKRNKKDRGFVSVMAVAIFGLGTIVMGQGEPAAPTMEGATLLNGAGDPGQYLGNVYKDEAAFFKITPPVNARVITKASDRDLMSFVLDAKSWGGGLQRITVDKSMSLDDYTKAATAEMNRTFRAVQVLENRPLIFQGKKAVRLTTSMEAELGGGGGPQGAQDQLKGRARLGQPPVEQVTLYRQQLIVQTKDNQFMVLTFYAPLRDKEEATRTFEAVAGSLELFSQQDLLKKRTAAILLGKKWLDERSAEEFKPKMNVQPVIFRMIVGGAGGTDMGYLRFDERDASRDGYKGVEMEMNSRSFQADGSIVKAQNVSFWAMTRGDKDEKFPHYSMWDNKTVWRVNVPTRADPTKLEAQDFWTEETGALNLEADPRFTEEDIKKAQEEREAMLARNPNKPPPPITMAAKQFHIVVNLQGDKSQLLGTSSGINTKIPPQEASPLPKMFEYMWTRMVDLTKPAEMSFVVFNSGTRKLALRTLVVTGKKERIAVNGKVVECWKCIDELDPGNTILWVDDSGRIVSMRTSDQTLLLPTTEAEMQRRWAARLGQQ